MALAIMTLFIWACFSAITFNRVACAKAKEQAIVSDFLIHYCETIKGLPFSEVTGGHAINPLFDGSANSTAEIRIPSDTSWVALNTDDFEIFHPDLIWIHNRNPKMQVTLTTTMASGTAHTKALDVRVQWDSPLQRGGPLREEMVIVRVKDL